MTAGSSSPQGPEQDEAAVNRNWMDDGWLNSAGEHFIQKKQIFFSCLWFFSCCYSLVTTLNQHKSPYLWTTEWLVFLISVVYVTSDLVSTFQKVLLTQSVVVLHVALPFDSADTSLCVSSGANSPSVLVPPSTFCWWVVLHVTVSRPRDAGRLPPPDLSQLLFTEEVSSQLLLFQLGRRYRRHTAWTVALSHTSLLVCQVTFSVCSNNKQGEVIFIPEGRFSKR